MNRRSLLGLIFGAPVAAVVPVAVVKPAAPMLAKGLSLTPMQWDEQLFSEFATNLHRMNTSAAPIPGDAAYNGLIIRGVSDSGWRDARG